MSLTQGDGPGLISFSEIKITTKFNSQPSSFFQNRFYYPHVVAVSLTAQLYIVDLSANVRKLWMNYVNN